MVSLRADDLHAASGVEPAYHLVFVTAGDEPVWFRKCRDHLARSYSRLSLLQTSDELARVLQNNAPDAVFAFPSETNAGIFRAIHSLSAPPQRPLLVMLTEAPAQVTPDTPAELTLPPLPVWVEQSLDPLLTRRAEALALAEERAALQLEIAALAGKLKQQQRSTDEVNVLKNAIVRNVSHELKTPLLHVKSAVSMLVEDSRNNVLAQYATEATARLEGIIRNITQLADSLENDLQPVLVRDAVDSALRTLRRSWERKDHIDRVKIHIDEHLPPVLADKQGLSTVLHLLMDNGLKFSQQPVEVRAERVAHSVRFTIKDNGIGIPAEAFSKIFDLFYQVDSSTTRRFGGMGVGLALVKLILDRHNAEIHVESEEGQGSAFWFVLPLAEF